MDPLLEEGDREVVGLSGDILWKPDECRATVSRVEHGLHGVGQRVRQLFGLCNPIPVARDRLEAVVHGLRRVAEMLDLLQDRIGQAMHKRVTTDEEQRQPVAVSNARGRHHIGSTGSNRAGRDHDLAATLRLRIRDAGKGHALFGLAAIRRQVVLGPLQRMSQRRDVAVTEDRIDASEERLDRAVDLHRLLCDQVLHNRLRSRKSNGLGHYMLPSEFGTWHQRGVLVPGTSFCSVELSAFSATPPPQ